MDNMDRIGGALDTYDNVSNYSKCIEHCNAKEECFIWVYIEGSCWLKNENTFRSLNENVVGGIKDCKAKGNVV